MKKGLSLLLIIFSISSSFSQSVVSYVNPFIGTSREYDPNLFPNAIVPWGMVSPGPYNVTYRKDELKRYRTVNYIYTEPWIDGFSTLNLSGVGCPDLGVILLMPTTGNPEMKESDYRSSFDNESAIPGYYKTRLRKYDITCEMTATIHTSISRFIFPKGKSNILLDLYTGVTRVKGGMIKITANNEVVGYRMFGGFCDGKTMQTVYFVMKLSKPSSNFAVWKDNVYSKTYQHEIAGNNIGMYFSYETLNNEPIEVKIGISYVSIENARMNLMKEQPDFNFDKIKNDAAKAWENELSKIKVEGGTENDKAIFYTALYHTLIHPNVFNDVDGRYVGIQNHQILTTRNHNRYSIFSLWDTYRSVHPFLTLVYPGRQSEMVNSMIEMYKEWGWLPKWELAGNETFVMDGDPATIVICDSYLKGIRDFNTETAYEAMIKSATQIENNMLRPGLKEYIDLGFIPENIDKTKVEGEVSVSLEYDLANWNLAQMAKVLGKTDDYKMLMQRTSSYKMYFDKDYNLIRPKNANGKWNDIFDPITETRGNGFVEGSSWQYTFFVPHDIPGLITSMGGEKTFISQLQKCFDENLFSMGNEPDLAYPYLFNYVKGEEWRTQQQVHKLIRNHFLNSPNGIPGNDDCGALSSWLLFSMMGLYPDCPGSNQYAISSPMFDKIIIKLDPKYYKGKEFIIETKNRSEENIYINNIILNGDINQNNFISHQDIVNGGKIIFEMAKVPFKK